ncbi:MAG TPA: signal peptide peptidase SppA [Opitutaceae bacterium]|nr:signal peptide peptidase SppA [Opitutaceae bacterium]
MKNFFTSLLGALAALLIFTFGAVIVAVLFIGAVSALNEKTVAVEKGAWLVFDLSANIKDAPQEYDAHAILGNLSRGKGPSNLQLRLITRAIRTAAKDDRIAGLYLTGQLAAEGYGSGYAALQEVREAIETFKAAKKPVKAYVDFATTKEYYLISAASEIDLDPFGAIYMPGLATEPMFYTGAFEKFGIGVQVTRVGKYKSFVEPFIRKDMSPENRMQTQKLLDDVWGGLVSGAEKSRGLKPGTLQSVVDANGILAADVALQAKLVDKKMYLDEVIDELKQKTGRTGGKETFKQIAMDDYIFTQREDRPSRKGDSSGNRSKIAIVYAEGDIVDGEGEIGEVGGARYARELRRLRQDDSVKAIVLRVNSPGGSATASEAIQRELRLAMKAKPLIVSMGSYAASGGYWISTYANKIYAEPTTITGSIGVFGLFINVQGLANNLGLTFDSVKTGKYADSLTISRPKTDDELTVLQREVDWIYGQFITKVSDSRKIERPTVEEIAQGRVWSGVEAKKLKLVDEIGGLADAMKEAASEAKLGDRYRIVEFPRKKDLAEAISDLIQGHAEDIARSHSSTGMDALMAKFKTELHTLKSYNDPRGVYARMPFNLSLK